MWNWIKIEERTARQAYCREFDADGWPMDDLLRSLTEDEQIADLDAWLAGSKARWAEALARRSAEARP